MNEEIFRLMKENNIVEFKTSDNDQWVLNNNEWKQTVFYGFHYYMTDDKAFEIVDKYVINRLLSEMEPDTELADIYEKALRSIRGLDVSDITFKEIKEHIRKTLISKFE